MSVLNLPRLVFSGLTNWNPNTVNNAAKRYNEITAAAVPQLGVPWDQFVNWLMQENPKAGEPNGSWNVYGDHAVSFVGATVTSATMTTGPVNADPILGTGVQVIGLLYMDSPRPAPARLVDVQPWGSLSSQIFYEFMAIGNDQLGVKGRGACRMFSRWPSTRNLGGLPVAGNMGVIWQTAVYNRDLQWTGVDGSPALAALKTAAESAGNQGIVIQFASYSTLYYQTVTYQGQRITNGEDLAKAYQNGYRGGNPAQSALMGLVGVWGPGELASAPTERYLEPNAQLAQAQRAFSLMRAEENLGLKAAAAPTTVTLGPAMALVNQARNTVTVNFIATFPEQNQSLQKANLGTFLLQAVASDGRVTQIGQPLTLNEYNKAAYDKSGGVVEFPYQPSQAAAITNGNLQLVQQVSNAVALLENPVIAETDQRGVYIDQATIEPINVRVYEKGTLPTTSLQVLVAQYDVNTFNLITKPADQIVEFVEANGKSASPVLKVSDGLAVLRIRPRQAGICYLAFYPFSTSTPPVPPNQFPAEFFAVVRALPFDDQLEKSTPDSKLSFSFIYNEVLQTYDVIYPIMSLVRDLHDKNVVDAMAEQLKFAISLDTFKSTLYMPITRELSAGKRKLLQRYVNLLPNVPTP